jgi:hypothetical protein
MRLKASFAAAALTLSMPALAAAQPLRVDIVV